MASRRTRASHLIERGLGFRSRQRSIEQVEEFATAAESRFTLRTEHGTRRILSHALTTSPGFAVHGSLACLSALRYHELGSRVTE